MRNLILFLTEEIVENPEVVEEAFDFGKYFKELFTPELITTIVAMIGALSSIIALINNARKLAKSNMGTIHDVINAVQNKMDEENDVNITKVISPLVKKMEKIEDTEETLIKAIALMQDQTPEGKLALLNLLQSIGKVKDDTIVKAEEKVKKANEEKKENEEKAIKELEAIEKEEKVIGRV